MPLPSDRAAAWHARWTGIFASVCIVIAPGCFAAERSEIREQWLPTGQLLSPTAAPGSRLATLNPHLPGRPQYRVGQTISEALSPDRRTLLVLTSGYNLRTTTRGARVTADSNEYVFVFDVASGRALQRQVLQIPNTYVGIAFAPNGVRFVVSGGKDDDLHVFELSGRTWIEAPDSPISLHHPTGIGISQSPLAQGVSVTADSRVAVVANRYNASISIVDLVAGVVTNEIDLRPGKSDPALIGTAGGEYPNSVAIVGNRTAFVSSERDREIVAVDLASATVIARIAVPGNPGKMLLDQAQHKLYVAVDNTDVVTEIDTSSLSVRDSIPTIAPDGEFEAIRHYHGASPNALALSADGATLYVTNRGTNSLAVIDLRANVGRVMGLIPTGWYPSDVAVGPHEELFIVNTQSMPGPNPGNCLGYESVPCPVRHTPIHFEPNEYILNLAKGGLLSMPAPRGAVLSRLTRIVATNNHFDTAIHDSELMATLRRRIRHIIYIVKENRTYDQVLGDIGRGNSDSRLTEFPRATTPNLHALADEFVLLDNFYDSGNVSGNGWPWSIAGRESDAGAKMLPVNYAGRGGSYDWEGTNSNVNVALQGAQRALADPLLADPVSGTIDPDELPGTANIAAPDGPSGEVQQGYLWSSALRSGLSVRNYGFLIDLTRYSTKLLGTAAAAAYIPLEVDPYSKHTQVAYAADPELVARTDPYFRGFDTAFPDTYREQEWEREFRDFVRGENLPALSLVRFMADHTGSYMAAIAGVNTPELQVADNDFAVGRLVEVIAHSPYARDTLIFIVEDDAQDGPDHVDAHRSTAFVVGPYVRQHALLSQRYTTVNILRTMTDILGIDHLSLFDATQQPMSSVFELQQDHWDYTASVAGVLKGPGVTLPIPGHPRVVGQRAKPTHTATYWAARTRDMNFDAEDELDAERYNRLLWQGLMGTRPYSTGRPQ
jgi:YVTN family beta-propeller protein